MLISLILNLLPATSSIPIIPAFHTTPMPTRQTPLTARSQHLPKHLPKHLSKHLSSTCRSTCAAPVEAPVEASVQNLPRNPTALAIELDKKQNENGKFTSP